MGKKECECAIAFDITRSNIQSTANNLKRLDKEKS